MKTLSMLPLKLRALKATSNCEEGHSLEEIHDNMRKANRRWIASAQMTHHLMVFVHEFTACDYATSSTVLDQA
ncbi:uncharacterized protein RAG0_08128 [Rhynchosporium agropyri]|uniref:Uncharacterized protein n=1 Tax=Rhynchosporium agropyri TaxID=914238 RepID=A0A1E1KSB5_9HELO|nr:uncharacterized protein RAG0_08128 [Rhynchosporium agropyri]